MLIGMFQNQVNAMSNYAVAQAPRVARSTKTMAYLSSTRKYEEGLKQPGASFTDTV